MHGEGKPAHTNTSSQKCCLKKNKLQGKKSWTLLSTCIFSQRNLNMICSNTRYSGLDSYVCRGSKQASQPHEKSLEEGQKCRHAVQWWRASLRPQILSECKLVGLSSYARKPSGMNQILLQHRSLTNPCPWEYAPVPMAGTGAGWECQGGHRCLLGPAKITLLLTKRKRISTGCVLGGARRTWPQAKSGARRIVMGIPYLATASWGQCTKSSEACRYSGKERHKNHLQRHSPQGSIILMIFHKLCNTREEKEEIFWSNSPIAGMLNCRNEGNRSTPATVSGSRQNRRICPDPSLPPTPTLREPVSFVVWWKIYTVKQITA